MFDKQNDLSTVEQNDWKTKIILFLISQTISMFGSSLVQFAIIWYIARETNSGTYVTISTISSFLPSMIISIFSGVWADRYNRKTLIILADGTIAIATLILAICLMFGYQNIWFLFAISAIRSLGSGVQSPAVNAIIPQIVPEDKLMRVNGINGTIQSVVNLIAPAAGGAILAYGAIQYILLIDVATALIGISIFMTIAIPMYKRAESLVKTGYFTDLKAGINYAWSHGFIKKLFLCYMVFTFLITPAAFLNVLMVTRVFGNSYWFLTLNEICFFIGAVIGGVIISSWGGFKNKIVTLMAGYIGFGLCTVLVGTTNIFWVYLIIITLTGATMPFLSTPVMVILQERVEAGYQGRIFSLMNIIFIGVMQIGMLFFGPLSDLISIQTIMIITGAILVVFSIGFLFSKQFLKEGVSFIE